MVQNKLYNYKMNDLKFFLGIDRTTYCTIKAAVL